MSDSGERRIAILAHEKFPERAKTALGVLRYGTDDIVAVVDRDNAGSRVHDHVEFVPDVPIVGDLRDVTDANTLLIGISPIGGKFDPAWRVDVELALERGWDVISGLHEFLADDATFAALASESGAEIWDVRRPPADLGVSDGIADTVDADVYLTVGTDCSIGKMTTTFELVSALNEAGTKAAVIPTGQTGIMIDGWGLPIDRIVADFVAGAVEDLILERGNEYEVLIVEGQASIIHPAYSGLIAAIMHGSMPDGLILCHEAGRQQIHGFESFEIPPIETVASLYTELAKPVSPTKICAGALNTWSIEDDVTATREVDRFAEQLDAPATDVIRFGTEPIVEAIQR